MKQHWGSCKNDIMYRSINKWNLFRCCILYSGVVLVVFFFAACFSSAPKSNLNSLIGANDEPTSYPHRRYLEGKLKQTLYTMSLRQKASQVLMTGIDGKVSFEPWSFQHFRDTVPGAIILFGYNLADDPDVVRSFLASCQDAFAALGAAVPVLFAIDHEGGSVYRTGSLTSRLPSQRKMASVFEPAISRDIYRIAGKQLGLLGIHMNLAPVAEIAGSDSFMFDRVFSDKLLQSVKYSHAAYAGYRSAGIIPVLKHFPGNANTDPHYVLPRLSDTRRQLIEGSVGIFKSLFELQPPAVLVSSVIVEALDPINLFCFSYAGVSGFLREKLGFQGLVLTDDIAMSAIRSTGISPASATVKALRAGCDMVMTSDPDIGSIVDAIMNEALIDTEFQARLDEAVLRILIVKFEAGLIHEQLRTKHSTQRVKNYTSEMLKQQGDALLRSGGL